VDRRLNRRKAAAPAGGISPKDLDSIRAEVQHSVTDSVMRMLAGARRGTARDAPLTAEFPRFMGVPALTAPVRLLVPDVVDGSRDQSLGELATGLTASLRRQLSRRPGTQLLDARKLGIAGKPVAEARQLAREAGADYVVQGVVRAVGDDSVRVVLALHDANDPRFTKSLEHASLRVNAAALPAAIAPMAEAWLDHRLATRSFQPLHIPNRASIDSIVRQSQRWRDSIRKPPQPRADSIPPTA
jgi:TolB-like protein